MSEDYYEFGDPDWDDGFQAAHDGESCMSCPFPKGTPEALTWRRGYEVGQSELDDTSSLQDRWVTRLTSILPGTAMPVEDGLATFGITVESEQIDELIRALRRVKVTYCPKKEVWIAG